MLIGIFPTPDSCNETDSLVTSINLGEGLNAQFWPGKTLTICSRNVLDSLPGPLRSQYEQRLHDFKSTLQLLVQVLLQEDKSFI